MNISIMTLFEEELQLHQVPGQGRGHPWPFGWCHKHLVPSGPAWGGKQWEGRDWLEGQDWLESH